MPELTQPSEIAREALRRLATRRLQPTPDNYRTLYHEIAGTTAAETFPDKALRSIAGALPRDTAEQQRFARQLETAVSERDWGSLKATLVGAVQPRDENGRNWAMAIRELISEFQRRHSGYTPAKKREALEHVLTASSNDPDQLLVRMQSLTRSWSLAPHSRDEMLVDSEATLDGPETAAPRGRPTSVRPASGLAALRELVALVIDNSMSPLLLEAPELANEASDLATEVRRASDEAALEAVTARVKKFVFRLQWVVEDQTELKSALLHLLRLVIDNISELVIDDQWLHGQIAMINALFTEPMNVRRLDDVERRLKDLIVKQSNLKRSLNEARERLKTMLARFIDNLAGFTESTSDYHRTIERCAVRIGSANDISELSDVIDEVMRETRQIQISALHSRDELRDLKGRVDEAEREVAKLQNALAQASEMVRQDQLTGTLNRKGLDEALERESARCHRRDAPLCVALLDIDDFKKLNDTYGHQTGDEALVHLARVVRETLRPQDTVARYGGEEFVILLPETALEESVAVLTRLQRELTRRFFLRDNERILITFSAGVALMTSEQDADQTLSRADGAMYEAKRAGKNRVVAAS